MPQPTLGDVHVNRPLSNLSISFMQEPGNFIADRVFPIVQVQKKSDSYFLYNKEDWFRSQSKVRAPGTESAGSGYELDTDTYNCEVLAIHKDVDDQIRANSDSPLDADRDATMWVTEQNRLKKEVDWFRDFFTTAIWGTDFTPGTLWSAAGSDPVVDVRLQKRVIARTTGKEANKFVVSPDVDDILKDHPAILDRIKGGATRNLSAKVMNILLAELFEVDEYLVGKAVQDTAAEGATPTIDHIATKDALLVHSAPSAGIHIASAGYTFSWVGLFGASAFGGRIKRFRMEKLASDRVEGELAYDHKVVAPELGVFFDDVIA